MERMALCSAARSPPLRSGGGAAASGRVERCLRYARRAHVEHTELSQGSLCSAMRGEQVSSAAWRDGRAVNILPLVK